MPFIVSVFICMYPWAPRDSLNALYTKHSKSLIDTMEALRERERERKLAWQRISASCALVPYEPDLMPK